MRSRRTLLCASTVAAALVAWAMATGSGGRAGAMTPVVVELTDAPLARYEGGVAGLAGTAARVTGRRRVDAATPASRAYLAYLDGRLDAFERTLSGVIPEARVLHRYRTVLAGVSLRLPAHAKRRVASLPGVAAVHDDAFVRVATDNSPKLIGANSIWRRTNGGAEGIVVGIIDTGLWPEHPSFGDPPPRGDPYPPPPASFNGGNLRCDAGTEPLVLPFVCTNKVIAADVFGATYDSMLGIQAGDSTARDGHGHGTAAATVAAGNDRVKGTLQSGKRVRVSGVAPRAHVAIYKACFTDADGFVGCFSSDLASAIDQAVADGVDVISYSIDPETVRGGSRDAESASFLAAYQAGVFVAAPAGNSGPFNQTIEDIAALPWVMTVGASTGKKTFKSKLTLQGEDEDGKKQKLKVEGVTATEGLKKIPVIDAADGANPTCLPGANAWTGSIVLCERGAIAPVIKSQAVADGGGLGMILFGASVAMPYSADVLAVPAIHLSRVDGLAVRDFLDTVGTTAIGTFKDGKRSGTRADVMADFSSRGPSTVDGFDDLIKPDVTAPGVNVLAGTSPEPLVGTPGQLFAGISGTSMSAPHTAGAGALLRALHPDWTPGMIKSALMTSASTRRFEDENGLSADVFDRGDGRLDLKRAAKTGIVFDVSGADLAAYDAGSIAGPDLNLPSMYLLDIVNPTVIERTALDVSGKDTTYKLDAAASEGLVVTVEPTELTVNANITETFEITVDPTGLAGGELGQFVVTFRKGGSRGALWGAVRSGAASPTPTTTPTTAPGTPTPSETPTEIPTPSETPTGSGTPTTTPSPGGSNQPPVGSDDSYPFAVGNTLLEVGVTASGDPAVRLTGSLLDNDMDPDSGPQALQVISNTTPTAGALLTLAADGTFTYEPAAGFVGSDSFVYSLTDGQAVVTATVGVDVSNIVWFVDDSAGGGGDGRGTNPFNSLTAAQLAADVDERFFVYGGTYDEAIALKNGQSLIGNGTELIVNGFSLEAQSFSPVISNSAGDVITLALDNTISGLVTGNTTGVAITGTNVGTIDVTNVTINGTGGGLYLDGAAANMVLDNVITSNAPDNGIYLNNVSGNITVTNTVNVTNPGASAIDVANGDVRLSFNTVDISTTVLPAVNANVLSDTFTIAAGTVVRPGTTPSGTLVNATDSAIDWNWTSLDMNGGDKGLNLLNTTGAFTVTGVGTTDGSGGTIANTASFGLFFLHDGTIVVRNMTLQNNGDDVDEHGIGILDSRAVFSFTNVTINSPATHGIAMDTGSTITATIEANDLTITDWARVGTNGAGFALRSQDNAVISATLENSTIIAGTSSQSGFLASVEGASQQFVEVTGTTFDASNALGSGGIVVQSVNQGTTTYIIEDNTILATKGPGVFAVNTGSGTSNGRIAGNEIVGVSGGSQSGLIVQNTGIGDLRALIDDNTVNGTDLDGIRALNSGTGTGRTDATITNNTIGAANLTGTHGIRTDPAGAPGSTICVDIAGNDPTGNMVADIGIASGSSATVLGGYVSGDPELFLTARNNGASANVFTTVTPGTCFLPIIVK